MTPWHRGCELLASRAMETESERWSRDALV